jgi:lipoprotein-anchoring transpeptidase ErfK/SrfK
VIAKVEPPKAIVEVLKDVPIVKDNSVTSEAAQARISKAEVHLAAGAVIAARLELNGALNLPLSTADRMKVKSKLTELANDWLFSKKRYDEDKLVGKYNVRPGDVLENIGRSRKVSYQVLMWINGLSSPRALRAGSVIKVVNGPFHVIVDRSDFTMDLYLQNMYVKSYGVGLGMEGKATPVGEWCVKSGGKMLQPQWYDDETGKTYYKDDPDYPLGARWIGIKGLDENTKSKTGFALHGTKEPETIGVRSSRGCIRLIDTDIIELYGLLAPVHSRVRVVD